MQINIFSNTILVITFISLSSCYTCPRNDETVNVKLTEITGEWYMVAGTPITGRLGKCMHFQVKSNEHNFHMNFTTTSYRNNRTLLWKVAGNQSENELSATWQLSFSPRVLGPFRHQILAIDYSDYCTMVVCANDTSVIPKQMFGMIWSRNRTLPNDILSRQKKELSMYVDETDILDVDNTCNSTTIT